MMNQTGILGHWDPRKDELPIEFAEGIWSPDRVLKSLAEYLPSSPGQISILTLSINQVDGADPF